MTPVFDDVVIFCPETVTGGPEALHQLSYRIQQNGGSAWLTYLGPQSRTVLVGQTQLWCEISDKSLLPNCYARYHPKVLGLFTVTEKTLMIYPEGWIKIPQSEGSRSLPGHHAVWWLSVDYALAHNPELADPAIRQQYFSNSSIMHFYQCEYAADFLRRGGAQNVYPLYDYTDPDFVNESLIIVKGGNGDAFRRGQTVSYFPNKGGHLAARFFSTFANDRGDIIPIPIENMSKNQVRRALQGSSVYIDFGHHPGKDRVPREAAISGAVVMLNRVGAARFFDDHPLPQAYLFDEADIDSGQLLAKVQDVLLNPDLHFENQRFYRQRILLEEHQFDLQVKTAFFRGR